MCKKTVRALFFFIVFARFAFGETDIFPLDQVKKGLKGEGYTVFEDIVGIEKFEFEVLGVRKDFLGVGNHLIIARLSSKRLGQYGVVAGMSGSPVYINGKLLGAVGYGFGSFTETPIAGITPIELMFDLARSKTIVSSQSAFAIPISLPIVGLAPQVAKHFASLLKSRGFSTDMTGFGLAGSSNAKPQPLIPGGPVAAALVVGDTTVAAIGTVTAVVGNRFYAFGHPFLETGASELPVLNAEIITTIFSQQQSSKFGQPTAIIGRLTDDRIFGITGTIGDRAKTIPMKVVYGDKTWNFGIAVHPKDSPLYAALALGNALNRRVENELSGTLRLKAEIVLSNAEKVKIERYVAGFGQPIESLVSDLFFQELSSIVMPELSNAVLTSINVEVTKSPEIEFLNVLDFDAANMVTGRPLSIPVRFKPWQGNIVEQIFTVVIPRGVKPGNYDLIIADRMTSIKLEKDGGMISDPLNYKQYLERYSLLPKDNTICAYFESKDDSKLVTGISLYGLPASLRQLTANTLVSDESRRNISLTRLGCFVMPQIVAGSARGKIYVGDAG